MNEKENRGRFVSSCVVQQERNLNVEDDLGTLKGEQQQQHRVCLGVSHQGGHPVVPYSSS